MKKAASATGPGARPPRYPIESVDNALEVLLLFGEREQLRLTEVGRHLGVASSTAHRILAMLHYRGFVRQDGRGAAYRPGPALTTVAAAIMQRFDIRATMRPYLERLHADLGETVHLSVLDGTAVRFVDAIESRQPVRVASRLGRSLPATATSSGKAMLAQLPVEQVRALYPAQELEVLTDNGIRTRDLLERRLAEIRRRGYATGTEESEPGVSSVAVAVAVDAAVRIGLNVSAPTFRMSAATRKTIAQALLTVAAEAAGAPHG
ncbi:IclR family transcriptional regulator [Nocardia terpenica]|uniref:IclR family transcriptional regulator n=1 Tax=Nocardia terpenica TaxID=455432 RepID=A0A164MI67_9NOCA|nr:IclR family transcriptional regulator [Nocardia terpenica]KZM73380.1 IclR family transcriptional regulator [Nocardia terpenica]